MDAAKLLFCTVPTVPRSKWLYLIHFDRPRAHALHYLGSSVELEQRLSQHANGQGARLTRALWEDSQHWQLAALFIPKDPTASIRELERKSKQRHNAKAYCPICQANKNRSPQGTVQYPTPILTSHDLRKDTK